MTPIAQWDIDRVAAMELATALQLAPDDDRLAMIAGCFSRHREHTIEWAAQRARQQIINALEAAAIEQSLRRSEAWGEGVAFAEQTVTAMSVSDILGAVPGQARSFGQILRTMIQATRHNRRGQR
ncbi:MAG: hypothetical protein KGN34_07640 [Sphingomonadales bacterium]|nr:hypothetical protein [Sphingomonadales bacterium]